MIHKTMRSILSVLLAALLLVTSTPLTPAFAGGGGVSPQSESAEGRALEPAADGTYLIYTAENLKEFAAIVNGTAEGIVQNTSANAKLMNDIDLSSVCSEEKGVSWTPIGTSSGYSGNFNGDGHTISGLYIKNTSSDTDYQGLFGYVSTDGNNIGTVQNLSVSGSVKGDDYVGGVVGLNHGRVENCHNTGSVTSSGSPVGGVVGYNGGTVKNCYNTGSVSGPDSGNSVGGVVGDNGGTVENCYNTGSVKGDWYVGGVVGWNSSSGTVTNCYNTGAVSGGVDVGGVVGYNSGTVENCYNTGTVTGTDDYVGGVVGYNISTVTGCYFLQGTAESGIGSDDSGSATPLTAEEFADQSSFRNSSWDFDNTWKIEPIFGRPTLKANAEIGGTANNPYKIFTATQLAAFRDLVNDANGNPDAWAVLMENITLNSSKEWEPIGNSESTAYTGTFDGDGHTISGLNINNDYRGLFGYVGNTGTVQNLTVSGSVKGNRYVGGIAGQNLGNVINCAFSGSVSGVGPVGGVVGQNFGTVENCYNTGSVTGSAGLVGGVVGHNYSGSVTNCYNIGDVSGGEDVGGVVGYNSSIVVDNRGTVKNCYNTGKVSGNGSVGGVVGDNGGSVKNCYFLQGTAGSGIGENVGSGDATATEKDDTAFHSGEVAYLLEQNVENSEKPVWGQSNLTATTSLPTLVALDKANAQKVYQVTFDYGDSFADNDGRHAYSYTNGVVSKPTKNPELDGHTLSGWYSDESLTTAWDFSTAVTKNMTLYAKWTAIEEPEPEPEEPPYTGKYSYEVFTSVGDNGTVTVDRYATEGDKVTIDVTPDQAYKLDDLSVTAGGKEVALTAGGDGTYTFTMPSADVKISATFAEDPDWTPDEPEEPTTDVSDLFIDIAPDAWYKDAVQYAYDNGLMTGVSANEFAPEQTTTRAMIVSILARLENVTTAEAAGFADVNDEWYATAVNWAANVGVVNGYEDNTFQPNTAITREQLAAILMNYAAYKGEDVSARADLTSYTDQPSTWAQEAMSWAVAEGLINGVTNDQLQPQGNATRAQVAAILQRFLEA